MTLMKNISEKGFTLIEVLVIVMLLSVASVSLVTMFGQVSGNLAINHDIHASAQMAQECGEYLMSLRREYDYNMNGVTDCSALNAFNGNGPATVTITNGYTGQGCPAAAICRLINVSSSYGSGSASLDMVMVSY